MVKFDRYLTRSCYHHMLFGYVNAIRFNLPTITIEKAIANFMKYHGLTDDEFNSESARVTYHNMAREFINLNKDGKKETTR